MPSTGCRGCGQPDEGGRKPRRSYCLSSVQVCSPLWHLNMRTIPPVWVFSIFTARSGFRPQ